MRWIGRGMVAVLGLWACLGTARADGVSVQGAWARASVGVNGNGAVFLVVTNAGANADRMIGAASGVAKTVELHSHIDDGGVMRMRKVEGVDLPAGQTIAFQPGGYHVMLIDLVAPLKEGDSFPVTLTFQKAAPVTVPVVVKGVAAMEGMDHDHHMMMGGPHP